jgi:hypothetical protein
VLSRHLNHSTYRQHEKRQFAHVPGFRGPLPEPDIERLKRQPRRIGGPNMRARFGLREDEQVVGSSEVHNRFCLGIVLNQHAPRVRVHLHIANPGTATEADGEFLEEPPVAVVAGDTQPESAR